MDSKRLKTDKLDEKPTYGAGEMILQLRALDALAEDLTLVPSRCTEKVMSLCVLGITLLGSHPEHIQTHINKVNILKYITHHPTHMCKHVSMNIFHQSPKVVVVCL